jgi:hypothetical protein
MEALRDGMIDRTDPTTVSRVSLNGHGFRFGPSGSQGRSHFYSVVFSANRAFGNALSVVGDNGK